MDALMDEIYLSEIIICFKAITTLKSHIFYILIITIVWFYGFRLAFSFIIQHILFNIFRFSSPNWIDRINLWENKNQYYIRSSCILNTFRCFSFNHKIKYIFQFSLGLKSIKNKIGYSGVDNFLKWKMCSIFRKSNKIDWLLVWMLLAGQRSNFKRFDIDEYAKIWYFIR